MTTADIDPIEAEIKQRRLEVLEDTCRHFNSKNLAEDGRGVCLYALGCAIGRRIPDLALRERLDRCGISSSVRNDHIFRLLPAELQELGKDFLSDLQVLHDTKGNWNETGLSNKGKAAAAEIRRNYCT